MELFCTELEDLWDFCLMIEMIDILKKSESLRNIILLANRVSRLTLTSAIRVVSKERKLKNIKIAKNLEQQLHLRTTMTGFKPEWIYGAYM